MSDTQELTASLVEKFPTWKKGQKKKERHWVYLNHIIGVQWWRSI